MTPAELSALADEIKTDPRSLGYAAHLPDSPGIVADLLNAQTQSVVKERYVTARTIMAECTDGAAILDALNTASGQVSSVKWMMTFLQQDSGMDAGHPKTQAAVDQLVQASLLSSAYGDELKAIANQPASRAELLGLPTVTVYDLIAAGVVQ